MRTTLLALLVLPLLPIGAASAGAETSRHLTQSEIVALIKPHAETISRCYLDHASDIRGAGELKLEFAVHRTGALDGLVVHTPKLPAKLATKIDSCVREAIATVKFPARRNSTTAVVPYFFQHTAARNSGPQESCWNPRGCKS